VFGDQTILLGTLSDLNKIPNSFDQEDVIDYYSSYFHSSGITVFGIVNIVYIIRKLISRSAINFKNLNTLSVYEL